MSSEQIQRLSKEVSNQPFESPDPNGIGISAIPVLVGVGLFAGGAIAGAFFGGNKATNYSNINQDINNQVYVDLSSRCVNRCDNLANNTNVVIRDSVVDGSINFSQICAVKADCIITNSSDTYAQTIVKSISEQQIDLKTSFLTPASDTSNRLEINNKIRNQISQVMSASCQASVSNIRNNTLFYLQNSRVKGDVDFSQEGNLVSNCTMNNTAKVVLYNEAVAQNEQINKVSSALAAILIAIAAIIVLAILGFTIFKAVSSGSKNP